MFNVTATTSFSPNWNLLITKIMDDKKRIFFEAAKIAVRETTEVFYQKVFENLSLPYHTPKELRMLDHPFAARHGIIQEHGHNPIWGVHAWYGVMAEELRTNYGSVENISTYGMVGWLEGYSPEVGWVILGTSKMLPRPVLRLTAQEMDLPKLLKENFLNVLPSNIRREVS